MKQNKRVLYAEDEYTNRKLMEYQLKRVGIVCDLAPDGVVALEMFRRREYSLVILDQYMPGLNGDQLARKIREIDTEIPIVAITSDDSQVPLLEAAGIDRVFLKPLRGVDYVGAIKSYL